MSALKYLSEFTQLPLNVKKISNYCITINTTSVKQKIKFFTPPGLIWILREANNKITVRIRREPKKVSTEEVAKKLLH